MDDLAEYQAEGSVLLDVDGEPFGTLATVNRRIISIDSLPPHVTQAFLAVEDQRFYEHGGIDFRRLIGATISNVKAGGVAEGGSTITQQLARNLFPEWLPYQERSLRRKVMEARVARQIERSFEKDKILELYLNHIYLGEGAYGIEAASRAYFGKPAAELTLAEAAVIGGLPQAPSQINPVANPERARERRDLVLREMAEAGYVSEAEAEEAQEQEIRLALGSEPSSSPSGSYFIERVRQEMETAIGSRFYTAGLKIYTTMDATAQRAAEEELARQLDAIEAGRFGRYRYGTYPEDRGETGSRGETTYAQGAVVLLDAESGEVRALVGGRDFQDSKFDRAGLAKRQPGSAFKPFVYMAGLERFGSPMHVLDDSPVRLVMTGGRVWEPRNYTGRYDGPITMREAITRSKNAATVNLAQEVGIDRVVGAARDLGISGDIPRVPSTALGVAEVTPTELARAYAAFGNGGTLVEPHFIRRVEDRHGRVVWEARPNATRMIDPALAFVLTSMLQDVVRRGTGTAARVGGYRGPAAGKTGTTNDAADVWFIGYTPDLVGSVWIGMDERKTLVPGASGGTLAAPVWGRIMGRVYAGRRVPIGWSPPSGVSAAEVDLATGAVVGDDCPASGATYTEYFIGRPPFATCASVYPRVAGTDTLWNDEEWGTDTLAELGIDWPELEELRRRMRIGTGDARGSDTMQGGAEPVQRAEDAPFPVGDRSGNREETRAEAGSAQGQPPRSGRSGEEQRERSESAERRPRVLGVPVQRDSTPSPAGGSP
jgi:penicillin-binding protein 1A